MNLAAEFFLLSDYDGPQLQGHYAWYLVALSLLVAVLSSCAALHMVRRARAERDRSVRQLALASSAFVLGGGVWAMHFIGMLSLDICSSVPYLHGVTILSMVPSVLAAGVAVRFLNREGFERKDLLISGTLVGLGIGLMHYSGMEAMEVVAQLRYDPAYFLLSLLLAVVLAIAALWIGFGVEASLQRLRDWQRTLLGGAVMGLAISGMHYTGMAAARFLGTVTLATDNAQTNSTFLAVAIFAGVAVLVFLVVGVNVTLSFRSLARRYAAERGRLATTMDTVVDALITIDRKGTVLDLNVAAVLLFGWEKEALLGRNVSVLMPDPFRSNHDAFLSNYLATGTAKIIGKGREVSALHRDGTIFPIRLAIGHARAGGEDLFVGCITDLSAQKAHLFALERAQAIIEASRDAIISKTLGGVITSWNLGAASIYGFSAEEAIGQFMGITIPPDLLAQESDFLARIGRGERIDSYETVRQAKDGRRIDISLTLSPLRDQDDVIVGISHIARDIGERKNNERLQRAKERAEQAVNARTELMVSMNHEVRTPLNLILGFSDVLLSGQPDPASRQHVLDIRNSAQSLLNILNTMLDSVELGQGKLQVQLAPFKVGDLLNALRSAYGPVAERRNVGWKIEAGDAGALTGVGDEEKTRQVLTHLLDNAFKFTRAGEVTLGLEVADNALRFSLRDTGIGMSAEQLAAVFQPLTQADASLSRQYAGIGMGCTLSRQLAELLGGSVQVQSTPGAGTCFLVNIPFQQERRSQRRDLHILAVDDVALNLKLIEAFLGKDHRIETASGGQAAIDLVANARFDVVLMDIQMPQVDGLQATRKIRENELAQGRVRVPIIAVTANTSQQDRQAALDAGMDDFICKPIDRRDLVERIQRVVAAQAADATAA